MSATSPVPYFERVKDKMNLIYVSSDTSVTVPTGYWFCQIIKLTSYNFPRFMMGVSVNSTGSASTLTVGAGSYYGMVPRRSSNDCLGIFDSSNLVLASRDSSNVASYSYYPVFPAEIWDLSQICPNFYQ